FGDRPSRRGDDDDEEYLTDPSIWIRQAIDDIWSRRPAVAVPEHQVGPLREYLARYWIDQQADYHARAHRVHDRKERRLRYATIILFAVALVAATAHILVRERSGQDRSAMASALVTASLVTPAIGAALHGVGTQRQHRRHAETYERMEKLLRKRGERMRKAGTLAEARRVAESVERLTRDENSDWFGITRFHDVDLVT
ncbi:MAG TPA: cytochrome PufQ, partial [Acidimicrobiia bacterium]|nr:cytochrome PufQ [Acidimicrobiia bacterium]